MQESARPRLGPPTRARATAWAGLALAGGVLLAHARHFDFLTDDAFISFRYANNLVRHGELTFNPGERVEGYTNVLWTIGLALVLRLGGDPAEWSKSLGIAFSEGTLVVLFLFSTRARTPPARRPEWGVLAPLLLALASPFAAWSEGGLETALFTFLVTAAALRHVVELDGPRRPWSAVLLALATLARPEGALLFAVIAVHRIVHATASGRRSAMRSFAGWASLFAGLIVPYWAWRWAYYGYPLPNTYYAKTGPPLWGPGWRYVGAFIADTHVWVALPLLAIPWPERPDATKLKSLLVVVMAPWTVYVAAVGGDFMGSYRFLVPVLPLLALMAQEGLAHLSPAEWIRAHRRRPALAAAVLALLVVADAVHNWRMTGRALEVDSRQGVDSIGWLKQFVTQTSAIGRYVALEYPEGTTLATTAAGVIPYYSRMPTMDMLGLNDVSVAHQVPATGDRPGHRKVAPEDYVLARHPHLLIAHPWITAEPPVLADADLRYWRDHGYAFRTVAVPGLHPPFWSYLEAEGTPRLETRARP